MYWSGIASWNSASKLVAQMLERTITIINKLGLHARAASKFVNVSSRYSSKIEIGDSAKFVNGKSIMSVMLLAAAQGTQLVLRTNGDDEAEAMEAITALIADRFGEGE
jgi:phosphotransferase system HPr (HPr) family protein